MKFNVTIDLDSIPYKFGGADGYRGTREIAK